MTLYRLAKLAGVSRSLVTRLWNGQRSPMGCRYSTLEKLAAPLGMTVPQLRDMLLDIGQMVQAHKALGVPLAEIKAFNVPKGARRPRRGKYKGLAAAPVVPVPPKKEE